MINARRKAVLCAAAVILLASPRPPLVRGQSLLEPGARSSGMGGAFVALADDTSALFYNPAGLVFLKGFRAKTNLLFSEPTTSMTWPPDGGPLRSHPLAFRGSAALNWRFWKRAAIGVGFFTPHIFHTDWASTCPGADLCLTAKHSPLYFRTAASLELFPGLSVGGGIDIVSSSLRWTHMIAFPNSAKINRNLTIESRLDLNGSGSGFAAGLLWKVHRGVQVGMSYQSDVTVELSGRNTFITPGADLIRVTVPSPRGVAVPLTNVLDLFYSPQEMTGRLTLPGRVSAGVAIVPFSRLSLLLDARRTRWREFGAWEFRSRSEGTDLSPDFSQEYRSFYAISPDYGVQSAGLKLRDVWDILAGLELRPGAHVTVRSGLETHGGSSVPGGLNPLHPDLDQNIVSLGLGYEGPLFSIYDSRQVSELSFDIYLRYGSSHKKASSLPGHAFTYRTHGWVAGVGVGFNF